MNPNSDTLTFIVTEHNESHKLKKGDVVSVYKVKLESTNGKYQIQRKSESPGLLDEFPMEARVAINMCMAKQEILA